MKRIYFLPLLLLIAQGCSSDKSSGGGASSDGSGQGGSLARFAVVGSNLYTVDDYQLQAFDVSNAAAPRRRASIPVGVSIETIFPKDGYLFIGSRGGMYIYSVATLEQSGWQPPEWQSTVWHVTACDPVVVNDRYAFVTLNSASPTCWRTANELQIISIADKKRPELLRSYSMESPLGLGVDNNTLFVCDNGWLKVYDVTDGLSIKLRHEFPFPAEDVIPADGLLIAVGSTGLKQYRYDADTITPLSTLTIGN